MTRLEHGHSQILIGRIKTVKTYKGKKGLSKIQIQQTRDRYLR